MNILVPTSHQPKKKQNKNPGTQRRTTAGHTGVCGEGGVTAPNKYHMPKQLAPPSLMVETFKKAMGGVERVGVCLWQSCG